MSDVRAFIIIIFHSEDVSELYPMKLIHERAFANQDQMVTGDLHETYYQVCTDVVNDHNAGCNSNRCLYSYLLCIENSKG